MSKRRTWRWVTRDSYHGEPEDEIRIWPKVKRPTRRGDRWATWSNWDALNDDDDLNGAGVCVFDWHRLTGITVPTDRPIKVDFGGCKVVKQ
jgi:hypothetical protein